MRRSAKAVLNMPAPQVGEYFRVTWRDGKTCVPAEIIERRPLRDQQPKKGKAAADPEPPAEGEEAPAPAEAKAGEMEYYVHYVDYDRRLDEWVKVDRVDLQAGPQQVAPEAAGHGHHGGSSKKRKLEEAGTHDGATERVMGVGAVMKEHEEITKVKNIQCIELGRHEVETWYYSPFPQEYCHKDRLFICEFCLKYVKKRKALQRHRLKCHLKHPPGDEIYRDDETKLSVFEVDGKTNKVYCQNLCLLAKLFLDHKTLYYDVDPFLFYVLCEMDERGGHLVGYFSKEKSSGENYNLACILTFPPYQRHGYGKFLISLSYELTKREQKVGSPEKPLSDLGKLSYRSYWSYVLLTTLEGQPSVTLKELSSRTGIKTEDIVSTLQSLGMIRFYRGQHIIGVRKELIKGHLESAKKMNLAKPHCLHWPVVKKK